MAWWQQHLWAIWFIAALGLSSLEMLTGDFTLLMLGGGALAGGLTALVFPGLWWLQLIVALVVATAMLGLVRPSLLRRFKADPEGYHSQLAQLVGSQGVVREPIQAGSGTVLVNGDTWTARTLTEGQLIPAGERITVTALDGVVAVVAPVRELPTP